MKNMLCLIALIFVSSLISCAEKESNDGKIVLTYGVGTSGLEPKLTEEMINGFKEINPNVEIKIFEAPSQSSDDVRALYFQMFEAQSSDIDVFNADVVWVGEMADHLLSLNDYPESMELSKEMFQSIVENNTVDGKLIAMPLFPDSAYLFYRKDLLEKYGYKNPPNTYQEMTEMARVIMDGERDAGNPDFVGFVFQGNSYEGLTCDALEWISSFGGGTFVEPNGDISINNPNAIEALTLAQSWVGTISPSGVTGMNEDSSRQVFQSGNAAFLRIWIGNYSVLSSDDSVVKDKFAVSLLPTGKPNGKHSSTLGGWQIAINKYTKHPKEAVQLLNYITGKKNQKVRAILGTTPPAYVELYSDPEIPDFIRNSEDVYKNSVPRPSTVTSPYYAEASKYISSTVHEILIGNMKPETGVRKLELDLEEVMDKVKAAQ